VLMKLLDKGSKDGERGLLGNTPVRKRKRPTEHGAWSMMSGFDEPRFDNFSKWVS